MRKLICASFISVTILSCQGQSPKITTTDTTAVPSEFNKNSNGLIYSDQDINALKFVVDSLNLKFKTCDLNKKYYAYPQAKCYSVNFSSKTNDLSTIVKALKSNINFDSLVANFNSLIEKVDSNLLVVQLPQEDDGKKQYLTGNALKGFNMNYLLSKKKSLTAGEWIYNFEEKREFHEYNSIECIYVARNLFQSVIPDNYARLVQYIDCMIDTSAKVFLTDKVSDRFFYFANENPLYKELNTFLNNKMKIKKSKNNYEYEYLSTPKIKFAIDSLITNEFVIKKVMGLTASYSKNGGGDDGVEELVAAFVSKQKALEIKRSRRVMGMCSMDESPRLHAWNIAMLAAETYSWDIFLRTHLDIMNDRFDRQSDGSYAWGKRQTYIKELEVLDINVTDMMLGLCLRSFNTSDNHYNGTVWRIGKALSESKDRLLFEEQAKKIMQDDKLDEFNRSLIFLLYHTYLNHLTDKDERKIKVTALKKSVDNYPGFIQSGINEIETDLTD
ncbi:hypothetical protein [Ferruginibacter sp.]